jgi:hypothetical protein
MTLEGGVESAECTCEMPLLPWAYQNRCVYWGGRAEASTSQCLAGWMFVEALGPDGGSTMSFVACLGLTTYKGDVCI